MTIEKKTVFPKKTECKRLLQQYCTQFKKGCDELKEVWNQIALGAAAAN